MRNYHMTWLAVEKRWIKKHKGNIYRVSPRQLGCEPTKEASWRAANEWWEARLKEIGGADEEVQPAVTPLDPASLTIRDLLSGQHDLATLFRDMEKGEAAMSLIRLLAAAAPPGPPPAQPTRTDGGRIIARMPATLDDLAADGLDALNKGRPIPAAALDALKLGEEGMAGGSVTEQERVRAVNLLVRTVKPEDVPADRRCRKNAEEWVRVKAVEDIHPGRLEAYERNLEHFVNWFGPDKDISGITADALENWFIHLATKVKGREMSGSYATNLYGVTKMLVNWLAEKGRIALPGNINRRRRFADTGAKKIEVITDDEIRALLLKADKVSERTKLFVLLALNCGMLQNDISELGEDEVDWQKATIRRKRSKTQDQATAPEVTYHLWPCTFALLVKHRSKFKTPNPLGATRVLTTNTGRMLVVYDIPAGGSLKRADGIREAFVKLEPGKPFKALRKTGASRLETHPVYGRYAQYYLAHAPGSIAERHYVKPDDQQFAEAIRWLGEQFGVS